MNDAVTPIRPFGETPQERKETLFAIARQLNEAGTVDPQSWRSALSKAVGRACGLRWGQVYGYMTTLGSGGLKEVRIACIGEKANAVYYGEGGTRRGSKPHLSQLPKEDWTEKFRNAITAIMAEKSPMNRAAIARLARGETDFSKVYKLIRSFSTEELEDIGYPKPGEYMPEDPLAPPEREKPLDENDNAGPPAEDASDDMTYYDASRVARYVMAFDEALRTLKPEARTRQNLATAMAKSLYMIDGYCYAHRDFAKNLLDGLDVFKPKFLK